VKLAERYRHLAYSADTDDACSDAASACVVNVLRAKPGAAARCAFKTPAGIVEAFADAVQVAPGVSVPRAAVLVWSHDEWLRAHQLLEKFQ
jgi:hypothetical protein